MTRTVSTLRFTGSTINAMIIVHRARITAPDPSSPLHLRACPRRFLSAESIEQCRRGADPSFILGRVIFIEPKVADDDTIFPVPVGETYYLLTAALVDST